jgi:hypothetical protein
MKLRVVGVIVVALIVALVFVPAALAVSQSTINAIIKDAQDGHLDGNWTKAEVQAAIAYVRNNPTLQQYSEIIGVLEAFQASGQPGEVPGANLSFTGSNLLLAFGAGIGLIGSGLLLRRRLASD